MASWQKCVVCEHGERALVFCQVFELSLCSTYTHTRQQLIKAIHYELNRYKVLPRDPSIKTFKETESPYIYHAIVRKKGKRKKALATFRPSSSLAGQPAPYMYSVPAFKSTGRPLANQLRAYQGETRCSGDITMCICVLIGKCYI